MHHYFEPITDTKGNALTGYYVGLVDSTGATVPIYADTSQTPILSVSGIANMVKVDGDGNVNCYVPVGTYTKNIFATDGTTLVHSVSNMPFNIDTTGLYGAAGELVQVGSRSALAAITPTAGLVRYNTESGREGTFTFLTAAQYNTLTGRTLTSDVTLDTQQGVLVAPSSDTTGASGAWVRRHQLIRPAMFGAVGTFGNTATDDSAALNACLAWIIATGAPNDMSGYFGISSGLVIDPGAYGVDLQFYVNFGKCNIFANAAISRIVTIQDCNRGEFPGQLHIKGTNFGSDANTSWTCDVGLYLNNVSNSTFGHIICEGLGYAGVEEENNPSQNDTNSFRAIEGVRIGSGGLVVTTRTRSANWSAAVNNGSYGSLAQTTTVTVDALPSAYAQTAGKQVLVQINGRLHYVTNINAGTNQISFFPWLTAAEIAAPGVLYYYYGAALVSRGNDSNINQIGIVKANGCSTAVEMSSLYGHNIGIVDAESCGSNCRLAASPGSTLFGGSIGMQYCEGNTFDTIVVGLPSQFTIGSRPAHTSAAKDVVLTAPLLTGDVFASTALSGITVGSTQGWLSKMKVSQDVASSNEALDFNLPATFKVPVYRPSNGVQTLALVAPDANLRQQYRLDAAVVAVIGTGNNGQPTTVTFTPPTGHSINGGAASASAVFSGFDVIALFGIYYDGATSWTIGYNNRLINSPSAAMGYTTGSGGAVTQATAKSVSVQLNKPTGAITMHTQALAANTAVAFTLNNNLIAADDELTVRVKSGYATAGTYKVRSEGNAAGSRTIILENVSAGSLSEAVVLGFCLVKGAVA